MTDEYIIISCPHCNDSVLIYNNELNCRIFRHAVYKQTGEQVTNILKDNSDFIGYIILKSKDYNILRNDLNKVANFVDINLLIS
jgi:hypothetical protein